jgi:hypothetical protein
MPSEQTELESQDFLPSKKAIINTGPTKAVADIVGKLMNFCVYPVRNVFSHRNPNVDHVM